ERLSAAVRARQRDDQAGEGAEARGAEADDRFGDDHDDHPENGDEHREPAHGNPQADDDDDRAEIGEGPPYGTRSNFTSPSTFGIAAMVNGDVIICAAIAPGPGLVSRYST